MIFRHHVHNARYVIKPTRYRIDSGLRETVPGIAVVFKNHYFDSEAAQQQFDWTDPERELVERKLVANEDFNRPFNLGKGGLYLDEREQAELHQQAEVRTTGDAEIVGGTCIFTIQTPQGAEVCGEPVTATNEDFCKEHAAVMAQLEEVGAGG